MASFVARNMNWIRLILRDKHVTGILLGFFAVMIILSSSHMYYDHPSTEAEQNGKALSHQQDEDETPVIKIGQEAITSVVQIILVQPIRPITNITFSEEGEKKVTYTTKAKLNSYFKALFNLIISPNAP